MSRLLINGKLVMPFMYVFFVNVGRHYIDVKWGGFPIASKPFLGFAVRLSQSEENIHPVISPVVLMQPKDNSPKDTTDFEKSSKR